MPVRIILMKRLLVAALLLAPVTGCAAFSDDAGGRVRVAAGFYPLAFVAERVGGDDVRVTNLTQPGEEPHDLSLSFKETADVEDADLVLYLRGFQPPVDDTVDAVAAGTVLDAADVVDLQPSQEDPGEDDPHFWQDPGRMASMTRAVADSLAELDPDHASAYRERADTLDVELEQ